VTERPVSAELYARAQQRIPGGVNSPVRAFRAVGGTPPFVRRASGVTVEDEDGQSYLDFVGSWGPLILGHAHPEVVDSLSRALADGTTYGAPCRAEVELAETIASWYPGLEQVRCVSSGTEATMSAIRLARGATGRDLIVKFSGCYHGHADHLLVAAGSGLATFGKPSSGGVPEAFASLTRVLPLDDDERLEELFRSEGQRIAAVIVEPIPANNGLLLQRRAYLEALRRKTLEAGALLIFDEVMSGFRVARGGAAELYGITPDLATFGKVIGGGMPVGAFGGRRDLMDHLAPGGAVYQAGTLSGNPLAMTAGLTTLRILEREAAWTKLEQLGAELESSLRPVLENAPFPARLARVGSFFWLSLQEGEPPRRAEDVQPESAQRYGRLFHALLDRGIWMAPSAYEVGFVSLAHRGDDFRRLAGALAESLEVAADPAAQGRLDR
jgi:glutamate-1-semialdehyde 2,1-aminomutase